MEDFILLLILVFLLLPDALIYFRVYRFFKLANKCMKVWLSIHSHEYKSDYERYYESNFDDRN